MYVESSRPVRASAPTTASTASSTASSDSRRERKSAWMRAAVARLARCSLRTYGGLSLTSRSPRDARGRRRRR